jgi:hypothetical protein
MSRTPRITMTSRAEAAKNRNAALQRRLEGDPFAGGSTPIPLKEPTRWVTRWASSEFNAGRHWEMTARKGWDPVTADMLDQATPESLGMQVAEDGQLCRGVRATERLYRMAAEDFAEVQRLKTEKNLQGIGSASKVKADAAEAAAASHGAEAGEYIHNLPGSVIDKITGGDAA